MFCLSVVTGRRNVIAIDKKEELELIPTMEKTSEKEEDYLKTMAVVTNFTTIAYVHLKVNVHHLNFVIHLHGNDIYLKRITKDMFVAK